VTDGTSNPCSARSATSVWKSGATAHASVASPSSAQPPAITRLRPRKSPSGPYALDASAIANTTADTVPPATAGETP